MRSRHGWMRFVGHLVLDLFIVLVGVLAIGIRGYENWRVYEYISLAILVALLIYVHHFYLYHKSRKKV